jgi:hypothetical protein
MLTDALIDQSLDGIMNITHDLLRLHIDTNKPYEIILLATLLTSIWTVLILLSTIALKLLTPLHRFTAWFFDLEEHPVKTIGIVAGVLVMAGSLIWSAVRALI